MIKLVIFDLDDTLIPEMDYVRSGFTVVADYIQKEFGFEGAYDELISLFNQDRRLIFNRYLDNKNVSYSSDDVKKMVELYKNHKPKIHFYPDVIPTFACLKLYGVKCALLTDGSTSAQKLKLDALDGYEWFDKIVYTDELGEEYQKPSPKSFELLKNEFDVDYDEIIFVGDNPKKDFYISKIYPIHTVRVIRDEAIYLNEDYKDGIKEEHTIKDFRELWNLLVKYGAKISEDFLKKKVEN